MDLSNFDPPKYSACVSFRIQSSLVAWIHRIQIKTVQSILKIKVEPGWTEKVFKQSILNVTVFEIKQDWLTCLFYIEL